MSVSHSREVHPKLSAHLPKTIKDKSQVKQAFRSVATEVHPDQNGQDEDFKEVLRDKNYLMKKIDENNTYQLGKNEEKLDYHERLDEINIEKILNNSIEESNLTKENKNTSYEINHLSEDLQNNDIYSLILDDVNTDLKIGLEINPIYEDSRDAIEAHATYFSSTGEKTLKKSGRIDLENMIKRTEYEEVTHESLCSVIDKSVEEIGNWAVEYAENEIKQYIED